MRTSWSNYWRMHYLLIFEWFGLERQRKKEKIAENIWRLMRPLLGGRTRSSSIPLPSFFIIIFIFFIFFFFSSWNFISTIAFWSETVICYERMMWRINKQGSRNIYGRDEAILASVNFKRAPRWHFWCRYVISIGIVLKTKKKQVFGGMEKERKVHGTKWKIVIT